MSKNLRDAHGLTFVHGIFSKLSDLCALSGGLLAGKIGKMDTKVDLNLHGDQCVSIEIRFWGARVETWQSLVDNAFIFSSESAHKINNHFEALRHNWSQSPQMLSTFHKPAITTTVQGKKEGKNS